MSMPPTTVPFPELSPDVIRPGIIITDILTFDDYNAIEQEICGLLSPHGSRGSKYALSIENQLAQDRISNHLIPGRRFR